MSSPLLSTRCSDSIADDQPDHAGRSSCDDRPSPIAEGHRPAAPLGNSSRRELSLAELEALLTPRQLRSIRRSAQDGQRQPRWQTLLTALKRLLTYAERLPRLGDDYRGG